MLITVRERRQRTSAPHLHNTPSNGLRDQIPVSSQDYSARG
ncbi:hypothetical protein COLINT_03228 [Collinsella intestinalis DSM 13280]|uniref:Uncharacterized protein n=1 Tax=Collinsella intestinalis DSM 13280 TaxID=521003 RepID=C4FAY1_9ACTN|nr:hypothetical protein COLINT_03228 [Collinsella intestinalis DSM 13280]